MTALATKMGCSIKCRPMRPREPVVNSDDPRGQFAIFLRDWVDRKHRGDLDAAAKDVGQTRRTLQNWMKGLVGPSFGDLDDVAIGLGYADWAALAAAVKRHGARQ